MRRVSIASIAPERWRNGGGLTRTVASQGGDWRVSIAEVARDGPYSRFEGIARISVVLRGHGVVLRDEAGAAVALKPLLAAAYDGARAWRASLDDGPVTVLNVMTRIGAYRARVRAITQPLAIAPCRAALVVASDTDDVLIAENVREALRVEPSDGARFLVTIESETSGNER
ncbi:hypothetical protein BSFA1_46200 [Burkholderia sp. SFA1]|nr:hypothetical protein BSFA1_46200 [Burkholderia sp. SFA1]